MSVTLIKLNDNRLVSTFDDNSISLANNYTELSVAPLLKAHTDFVYALIELKTGELLASASCDSTIKMYSKVYT